MNCQGVRTKKRASPKRHLQFLCLPPTKKRNLARPLHVFLRPPKKKKLLGSAKKNREGGRGGKRLASHQRGQGECPKRTKTLRQSGAPCSSGPAWTADRDRANLRDWATGRERRCQTDRGFALLGSFIGVLPSPFPSTNQPTNGSTGLSKCVLGAFGPPGSPLGGSGRRRPCPIDPKSPWNP